MPNLSQMTNPPTVVLLGTLASTWASQDFTLGIMRFRTELNYASVCDAAGVATHAANLATVNIVRVAAVGGAETVMATWTNNSTGGVALAAGVPLALTVLQASGQHIIPPGDYLRIKLVGAGTTPALTRFTVLLDLMRTSAGNANN